MTGGAFRNNSNLLGRRREIEELETKVNQLKQNLTEMQNAVEENKNQRNRLRDAIAGFSGKTPSEIYRTEYCQNEYQTAGKES